MALPKLQEPFSVLNGWHIVGSMNDSSAKINNMKLPHVTLTEEKLSREGAADGDGEATFTNGHAEQQEPDFDPTAQHKRPAVSQSAARLISSSQNNHISLNDLQLNTKAFSSTAAVNCENAANQHKTSSTTAKSKNGFHPRSSASSTDVVDDETVMHLLKSGKLKTYSLENFVRNADRAVKLRRRYYGEFLLPNNNDAAQPQRRSIMDQIPYANYLYADVHGVCGENIIGFIPVDRHIAGPLLLNEQRFSVPLATPDTLLISSLNYGFHVLQHAHSGQGVRSCLKDDGMTRAPAIRFSDVASAARAAEWLKQPQNYAKLKHEFDSTSHFARQTRIKSCLKDRDLYLRFVATTGDAMGMNMVSKGVEKALAVLRNEFKNDIEMDVLSGNYCIDKKVSCLNWIEGRGKSVICDAVVPAAVVHKFLHTTVDRIAAVNMMKLRGAELFGSVGGFNCRAADIVAAIFVATGQDVAQVGTSSMCLTTVDQRNGDLYISCFMPSLEVGTVGGGTVLKSQADSLDIMGVRGGGQPPGSNAVRLSQLICASVLAGELAFLAQLAAVSTIAKADVRLLHAVIHPLAATQPGLHANNQNLHANSRTTIPLGLAGPLLLLTDDDKSPTSYTIPLATTEGALIASINRGFKAIGECGGVSSHVYDDCMSFVISLRFERLRIAAQAIEWIRNPINYAELERRFNSNDKNSSVKLRKLTPFPIARDLYLEFQATTGNSMGMQSVAEHAVEPLRLICEQFGRHIKLTVPDLVSADAADMRNAVVDSCAAVTCRNWIHGRGKSVGCDAVISGEVVRKILKCSVDEMVQVNKIKNNGSDLAGSVAGGFNCQAANIVAAIFLATGQNIAHVGTSSLCMTTVEAEKADADDGAGEKNLYISCRMPSLEVGTTGGATQLPAHAGALAVMGLNGDESVAANDSARRLARIICATVMAGELSLLAALSQKTLVDSHEKLNRRHHGAASSADGNKNHERCPVNGAGDAVVLPNGS